MKVEDHMKVQRVSPHFRWRPALLLAITAVMLLALPAQAASADLSTNILYDLQTLEPIPNSASKLVRTDNGLAMTIRTSGLEPGHAYTVWWVVFNNPEECITDPEGDVKCGEADILAELMGESGAAPTVAPAAGNVAGGSGKARFGAFLRVGDDRDVLVGGPLTNPRGAEIHLVVRDHGPLNPAWLPDQIQTFGGGCDQEHESYPPVFRGEGVPGDFVCVEPQFTFHVVD